MDPEGRSRTGISAVDSCVLYRLSYLGVVVNMLRRADPLRKMAEQDTVDLSGATVGEVLNGLTSQFGDLRKHLYNDEGKLRSYVNVYLNDEDIRYLQKESSAVKEGDTISIVPSIAGGRGQRPWK